MSLLPLQDVKVADFSWVGAGPRATKDLADYGATVIKIESRKRLDLGRLSPPFATPKPDIDASAFFAITNTSKKSVAINLSDPEGIAMAKKLVAWADVVVENFSHGFMDRIGLSYEELKAINPDIILISVSVAGRTGPLGKLRGYGNSAAALSGLASLSGWPDRPPHMPPFAYGDVVAPMFATVATLGALHHRRRTGEGQHIDISQVEPLIHTLGDVFAGVQQGDTEKPANDSPYMQLQGAYPCRGHNQFVAISVETSIQFAQLLQLAGLECLHGKEEHHEPDSLTQQLSQWTATQDKHCLAGLLKSHGISAEPVNDGRDVFTDPELIARGHYRSITHSKLGQCEMPAPPVRFSSLAIRVEPPPCLGEHLHDVFVDMLGESADHIEQLVASGALA